MHQDANVPLRGTDDTKVMNSMCNVSVPVQIPNVETLFVAQVFVAHLVLLSQILAQYISLGSVSEQVLHLDY